jgi:exopolysaccharide production protein ExoQ
VQFPVRHPTSSNSWARWVARLLWSGLWFWLGFRLAVPLFFKDNLFIATAINVFVLLAFASGFMILGLFRPSLFRSWVLFWAFGYWLLTVISSLVSPFVTHENIFRVFGLLAVSGGIILALVVFSNISVPAYGLIWGGRAYILGVLSATIVLVLTNPSIVAFIETGSRFGDPDLLHPNALGISYGIAVVYLLFVRLYRMKALQIGLAIIMIIALLATFSKTAIVGTLVAMIVGFWLIRGVQRWLLLFLVFCSILAITGLIGDYLISQIRGYWDAGYAETLSGRTVLWSWVLDQVNERPVLGHGYMVMKDVTAFDPRLSSFKVSIVHAHNAYLDVLFSSGYVGLAFFFVFWLYYLRLLFLGVRELRESTLRAYYVATFAVLFVRSFTEAALNLGFDFWIALAAGLALEKSLRAHRGFCSESALYSHPLPATRR